MAARMPSARRFSIAHLALLIPWVALVIDAWNPIRDNSFLWHVRAGTLQLELDQVLVRDPFSFTVGGQEWLTQSWLAELTYGWAENLVGLSFVPWVMLVTTTLTFAGIALVAYRESESVPATAFILVLSTLLMISFLVPRPVIFSYLLFVLVILAWDRVRLRWTMPFLFWIWASVHGSFVIGLAYIGLTLVMRREWRALPSAIATGVVTLATAHGLGVIEILLEFGSARDTLSLLSEWRRPTFSSPTFLPFLGGIAFVVVGAYRKLIRPSAHLWLLIPFLVLGFSSLRAVPPAWLGILPLVSLSLSGLALGSRRALKTLPAAVFAFFVFLLPIFLVSPAEIAEDRFPVEAANRLADVPTFHDDRVGGYLIWAEWPGRLVYLDDRAELYGERMREFVDVRNGTIPWQPVFARDGIEQVLLRSDEGLIAELRQSGWTMVYQDENYSVLRS